MPTVLPRTTCGDPYPGNSHYTTRCEREPGHPGNMHRAGQLGWERVGLTPQNIHDAEADAYDSVFCQHGTDCDRCG